MTSWSDIYKGTAHIADRDDELIPVSRETLRLAQHALRMLNEDDYYHNNGWAEREILKALERGPAGLKVSFNEVTGEWNRRHEPL